MSEPGMLDAQQAPLRYSWEHFLYIDGSLQTQDAATTQPSAPPPSVATASSQADGAAPPPSVGRLDVKFSHPFTTSTKVKEPERKRATQCRWG